MARQRIQASMARVASIPHTILHHQFVVPIRAHRTATKVRHSIDCQIVFLYPTAENGLNIIYEYSKYKGYQVVGRSR